jgi:hypothetical protein
MIDVRRPFAARTSAAILAALVAIATGCRDGDPNRTPDTARTATPQLDSQRSVLTPDNPEPKYTVHHGAIVYSNSRLGRMQTYYFDEYGAREALYLEGDPVDVPFDVSVYISGWRYDYNSRDRNGIAKQQAREPGPLLGIMPDVRSLTGTRLEPRTIAGRNAIGFAFNHSGTVRAWLWGGIPLRVERTMRDGATVVIEATNVDVKSDVPVDRFAIPKDVTVSRAR